MPHLSYGWFRKPYGSATVVVYGVYGYIMFTYGLLVRTYTYTCLTTNGFHLSAQRHIVNEDKIIYSFLDEEETVLLAAANLQLQMMNEDKKEMNGKRTRRMKSV